MKTSIRSILFLISAAVVSSTAFAGLFDEKDENPDRPVGIKIGRRMTLRPYVSVAMTYDNNVGSQGSDTEEDIYWTANPALSLDYQGDQWSALLSAYYNYHAYCKSHKGLSEGNRHSYGENLRVNWSNSAGADTGWSLMLMQSYQRVSAADDLSTATTRGYNSGRDQVQVGGGIQRRFNEQWHADVNASFYYLNYDNTDESVTAYGWQRWSAGAEAGFAASRWTDILVAGSYQGYLQDNTRYSNRYLGQNLDGGSQGWTVQAGLGSYATERISYRLLAGWSRFEYAGGESHKDGFTYTASANWRLSETLNTMFLASSYYSPSEYEYASASRTDALSWGLSKGLIRNKLRANWDLTYRHETNEHAVNTGTADYDIDLITARLSLSYTLSRFISVFAAAEYMRAFNDRGDDMGGFYDYDRWRASVGFTLTY